MPLGLLRLLEHVHGHLGWLTVALLFHPAILLWPRSRRPLRQCDLAVALATAFVTISAGLGVFLYPEYRARIRPHLFEDAPRIGWLFERKEHLAFGALVFAWAGAAAYVAARRSNRQHGREPEAAQTAAGDVEGPAATLRRAAFVAFSLAAAMAMVVAAFGVAVAVMRTF